MQSAVTPWGIGVLVAVLVVGAAVSYWMAVRLPARRQFLISVANSVVVGLLLGAAAVFGVTLMVQQDKKPPLTIGDGAAILNRVEYGDRS